MFKLLMFFIILGLFCILGYAIFKIVTGIKAKEVVEPGIDEYIARLKELIEEAETKAHAGMENAEAKLAEYKERLKKAMEYKQKHL